MKDKHNKRRWIQCQLVRLALYALLWKIETESDGVKARSRSRIVWHRSTAKLQWWFKGHTCYACSADIVTFFSLDEIWHCIQVCVCVLVIAWIVIMINGVTLGEEGITYHYMILHPVNILCNVSISAMINIIIYIN